MNSSKNPQVSIIAGPNGSGKSTVAEILLKQGKIENFINADILAKGLNSQEPDKVSIEAGRLMLKVINESLLTREDFSFETTLSGLSWKKFILEAKSRGYSVNIYFVIVDTVETAVRRVQERVKKGGHSIPVDTIIRRYSKSLKMFKGVYGEISDRWWVFDNTLSHSQIIATKNNGESFTTAEFKRIFND